MNRREFTKLATASTVTLSLSRRAFSASSSSPQFAITMDDFAWHDAVHLTADQRNQAILRTLRSYQARTAMFVVGHYVEDQEGAALLRPWNEAGHIIGNHTYSHHNFDSQTAHQFERDIARAEDVLKNFPGFRKLFRFPLLKEGNTAAKRDHVRAFLKTRGYRMGYVTIDNSDWAIDQRLAVRLQKDPNADTKPYRDFYLEHMWDRAQYYDSLGKKVLGRPVKHTVLMHFNLLNGLFLGDLMEMFKSKSWELIDAEEAFTDPVFRAEPKTVPAGESIVWALAKEKGTIPQSLRYPAEDGEYETARMNQLGL